MVLRNKLLDKRGLIMIHPWCAFIYLLMALVLTMCTVNPVLIAASLISATIYEIHKLGFKRFAKYIPWMVAILIITTIGNMFISHNGEHVLFYINDNRVTIEAGIYGAVFGLMFTAAFLWCDITQRIITGEKLTYMFGSFAPNLGLVISMTLHYIPMLRRRLKVVHNAQMGMGRYVADTGKSVGRFKKARQWAKEFSIVISWSLENAIDTSQIMTAMGYGTGRRTSYSNYRIRTVDVVFLSIIIVLMIPAFVVTLSTAYKVYYYPTFGMMGDFWVTFSLALCYLVYMLIPLFAERLIRWN